MRPPDKREGGLRGAALSEDILNDNDDSRDTPNQPNPASLYRRRRLVGDLVRLSLLRCGGSIVDRRRWPSPCTGEPAGEAVRS
jgi:hypothetical protein